MKTVSYIQIILVGLFATTFAYSADFAEADALYEQREENLQAIAKAKNMYRQLVSDDPVRAAERLGLLAYYEGAILTPASNRGRRTQIFADCRRDVEKLAHLPQAKTQYHVLKFACTGFWVKSAPTLARLGELASIKRYFNLLIGENLEPRPELEIDSRYMGGGIYRVLAGTYIDRLSSLFRPDLPDAEKALELIDRAIRIRSYPGDRNAGGDYYMNHMHRADIMIRMGRNAEAGNYLDDVIDEITELEADGDLPRGLEPETLGVLRQLRSMRDSL